MTLGLEPFVVVEVCELAATATVVAAAPLAALELSGEARPGLAWPAGASSPAEGGSEDPGSEAGG